MGNPADELAIRGLIGRYCDAVNRYNAHDWANTWAADGRWYFLDGVHEGRDAILAFWQSIMAQLDFAVMLANSAVLEIDGDEARGRWYTQEIVRTRGEQGRSIVGIYDDSYTRHSGQWLIQSRRYHKLYEAPTDAGERHMPYTPETDA